MNKALKRNLAPFQRIVATNAKYHTSPYSVHEQAIREHIRRGFTAPAVFGPSPLFALLPLLDQANKI